MGEALHPPGVREFPLPEPGDGWEGYLARLYEPALGLTAGPEDPRPDWCLICGSLVRDGWQATHYDRLHGFKGI